MENEYEVEVIKEKETEYIQFNINEQKYRIDLTSEDQTCLRTIFYEIIKLCFEQKPVFKLVTKKDIYDGKPLNVEIAEVYIKDLNNEIEKIYTSIPKKEVE